MTLADLDDTEGMALVALLRLMVRLDGQYSDAERAMLDELARELGKERFWALVEQAGHDLSEPDAVRTAARKVERQEARELIYAAVADVSMSDGIGELEEDLLDWLQDVWKIEVG